MRRGALALAAITTLLTACANQVAGSPIGTGQIVDPNPPPAASSPTTPPAPPTPSIANWPEAENGSDISACFDVSCEVELRAPVSIPVDPAFGLATLTLERVDDVNGAHIVATTFDGGTLTVDVYAEPGSEGATATVNGFRFVALATANGRAVIRMSPP